MEIWVWIWVAVLTDGTDGTSQNFQYPDFLSKCVSKSESRDSLVMLFTPLTPSLWVCTSVDNDQGDRNKSTDDSTACHPLIAVIQRVLRWITANSSGESLNHFSCFSPGFLMFSPIFQSFLFIWLIISYIHLFLNIITHFRLLPCPLRLPPHVFRPIVFIFGHFRLLTSVSWQLSHALTCLQLLSTISQPYCMCWRIPSSQQHFSNRCTRFWEPPYISTQFSVFFDHF